MYDFTGAAGFEGSMGSMTVTRSSCFPSFLWKEVARSAGGWLLRSSDRTESMNFFRRYVFWMIMRSGYDAEDHATIAFTLRDEAGRALVISPPKCFLPRPLCRAFPSTHHSFFSSLFFLKKHDTDVILASVSCFLMNL